MKNTLKMKIASLGLAGALLFTGCSALATTNAADESTSSTSESTTTDSGTSSTEQSRPADGMGGPQGGGPGGTDVSSVTSEEQLIELIQAAYGEAGLGLHRGHQPIEDVLDEVLAISHDELHVRMEAGQNLSDVAEDLGVGTQTLVDALVAKYSPAIDSLLAAGTITQDEADAYLAALEDAFTYRVTWDGESATPTFSGLDS